MDTDTKNAKIKCTLCGFEFEPNENMCDACVLHKSCSVICCPNCGFGIPKESKLVSWLRQRQEKAKE
ncbi:MAG: hypothetical protein C4532_12210 [Candidatus Abyssobacteria bacterium SURF_17]|jgi:ribosomal protein L37E|uniref:Uncharacterized protein n=1 Tax=Candidatus Abyssobacteria bacterium SURF_17 TaxID=2093361 RepID=A0A419EW41_9BACT|nr:MAG: hypothetical protein C4532_12210 [Candidatus Abyssubacteria bacterium SURF_17]